MTWLCVVPCIEAFQMNNFSAQKVDDIGLLVKSFFEVNSDGIDEIWEEEDWSERNIQASFFCGSWRW